MSKKIAILAPLALAACNDPHPVLILPPAELATCADEPQAPDLPARDGTDETQLLRDQMMLTAYLAMRSAWGDCKSKTQGLRRWMDSAGG